MPRCKNPNCKEKFKPKVFLQKYCMEKDECIKLEIDLRKSKAEKVKHKEMKIEVYGKEHRKYLQDEVNKLARMIDAKFGFTTCIDCGNNFGSNQVDACHLISVGKNNSIRYNLHDLHSGHNYCNVWNRSHEANYKQGLINRYGNDYLSYVENLPSMYKEIKLNNKEIYEKLTLVRKLIRNFETFKFDNAIIAREMFNKLIGIYEK